MSVWFPPGDLMFCLLMYLLCSAAIITIIIVIISSSSRLKHAAHQWIVSTTVPFFNRLHDIQLYHDGTSKMADLAPTSGWVDKTLFSIKWLLLAVHVNGPHKTIQPNFTQTTLRLQWQIFRAIKE